MRLLVVLAHPDPSSFNHAIADTVVRSAGENGHRVWFHDLYAEDFDPRLPATEFSRHAVLPAQVDAHCRQLAAADGIVVVHPNWWGQPPAVLKGWVDRVFRPGVAYEFLEGDVGEGVPRGLLRADRALVFNTANTPAKREEAVFGDPLETLWKNCLFGLCGVHGFRRRTFSMVIVSSAEERREWLREVRETVSIFFPPGEPA